MTDLLHHPHSAATPARFWTINFGHLLTLIGMAALAIGGFMKYESRISTLEYNQARVIIDLKEVAAHVNAIDERGTQFSQRGIPKDVELSTANTRRIEALEGALREMAPKVERLNANMDWLVNSLKDGGTIKHDGRDGH